MEEKWIIQDWTGKRKFEGFDLSDAFRVEVHSH
jgi:hypothetical protein